MADSFSAKATVALLKAIETGRADEIEGLLLGAANPNTFTDPGWTYLVRAVSRGNAWVIEKLLAGGADVNLGCRKPPDQSPFLLSPSMRNIRSQPEENPVRAPGWTPLMEATRARSHHLIKLLAAHGANPNGTTARDYTALIEAASIGVASIASTLLEIGARVDLPGDDGRTPLHYVMGKGYVEVMQVLLRDMTRSCG
jgi:ankyrin repeat protein